MIKQIHKLFKPKTPLPKSITVAFDKLVKDGFIQPGHYSLAKELIDTYGEFFMPDELVNSELGRLEHALRIADIVKPGFYVIETDELGPIGIVSGVEHLGKIQVDIAILPKYQGIGYGKSILNVWSDTLLGYTELPLVTTLTNKRAFDFYVSAGWVPTGEEDLQVEFKR